jgi:hypothetical protein
MATYVLLYVPFAVHYVVSASQRMFCSAMFAWAVCCTGAEGRRCMSLRADGICAAITVFGSLEVDMSYEGY